jgi:hypothetical protein
VWRTFARIKYPKIEEMKREKGKGASTGAIKGRSEQQIFSRCRRLCPLAWSMVHMRVKKQENKRNEGEGG